MSLGTGVRLSTPGARAGRIAAITFTPAALAGLSSWLAPANAALPAAGSDGLTRLAWAAGLPVTKPFPTLPAQTDARVYFPDGATPDATNAATSWRYVWHVRLWAGSGSILRLAHSLGRNNEDSPGQRCYCRVSANGVAGPWSVVELIESQDTPSDTTNSGRVTWPGCWAPNAADPDSPFIVLAIEAPGVGVALVARTVGPTGTLGSLFRVTTEDYTPLGGATKINYDATLGPGLLAYWKLHGHWGGNTALGQSWTVTYDSGGSTGNERAITPYPPDPTKYYAVWKNKAGFTANRVPNGVVLADGSIDSAPTSTDIPTSPNAPDLGTLADGRIYLLDSPTDSGTSRDPLAISFTDPGKSTFTTPFAVCQNESAVPVYPGTFKTSAAGYGQVGELGGSVCVGYGKRKEELWVTAIPLLRQVGAWVDAASGATQVDAGAVTRPVRQTVAEGDLIHFDGIAQFAYWTTVPAGSSGGCVVAFRPARVTGTQYLVAVADTATANNFWGVRLNGEWAEVVSSAGATVNVVRALYPLRTGTNYVVTVESSGTAWSVRINGTIVPVTVTSGTNTGDWPADVSGPDVFSVGALKTTTTGGYFQGRVGVGVLTSSAIPAGQLTQTESYAAGKIGGVAAVAVYLADAFTGANGTNLSAHTPDRGGPWTAVGGTAVISGNTLTATVATAVYKVPLGVSDYRARLTLSAQTSAGDNQFHPRYVDASNKWMVRNNGGTLQLYETVAGVTTLRSSQAGAGALPQTITVTCSGIAITATCGSATVTSSLGTLATATDCALRMEDTGCVADDLVVAD